MPEGTAGAPRFSKNKSKAQSVMERRAQMFRERARASTNIRERGGHIGDSENSTGTVPEYFHTVEFSPDNSSGCIDCEKCENSNISVILATIQEKNNDSLLVESSIQNQIESLDDSNKVSTPSNNNSFSTNNYSPNRNGSRSIIINKYSCDI